MTWLWILAVPLVLGLAFAGFALSLTALCRRYSPATAANDWFPILVTGAFVGLLLFLLPIYEAWSGN